MSFIKGLSAINAFVEEEKRQRAEFEDSPKAQWLKLAADQNVKLRFVNELDEESPGYGDDRGVALVMAEHASPDDFKRKAQCSMENEGKCWACERHEADPKAGWRVKRRFYTNVITDDGLSPPQASVWSQSTSNQSAFPTIVQYALQVGSISNVSWSLTRNGVKTDTTYTLIPMVPDTEPYDWSKFEYFDLEKSVLKVEYAKQEAFYLKLATQDKPANTEISWA